MNDLLRVAAAAAGCVLVLVLLGGCSVPGSVWGGRAADGGGGDDDDDGRGRGRGYVAPGFALGEAELDLESGPRDDTEAVMARLSGEFLGDTFGGGAQLSLLGADDDLLADFGTPTDLDGFQVYAHITGRARAESRFRLPIRLGPFVDWVRTDSVGIDVRHLTLGGMVEVMPEVDIMRDRGAAVTAFGGGRFGIGRTLSHVDVGPTDDTTSSRGLLYGFETGVRVRAGAFSAAMSYLFRGLDIDDADLDGIGVPQLDGRDISFSGISVVAGFQW